MFELLIFGGTTEGRMLAEFCVRNKLFSYISVATDYGEKLLEGSEYLRVLKGRMDSWKITDFIKQNSIRTVVDATHPYAVDVTKNIRLACKNTGAIYIRVKRDLGAFCKFGKYFDDINSLVRYLNTTDGKILVTTGSKELTSFCSVENFSKRCIIRVLPSENIVTECVRLGFRECQIIAEKGPFSQEKNTHQLKKFNARYLVTKESGYLGGFENKVKAALECGVDLLIIRRPDDSGMTLEQAEKLLLVEKING